MRARNNQVPTRQAPLFQQATVKLSASTYKLHAITVDYQNHPTVVGYR